MQCTASIKQIYKFCSDILSPWLTHVVIAKSVSTDEFCQKLMKQTKQVLKPSNGNDILSRGAGGNLSEVKLKVVQVECVSIYKT